MDKINFVNKGETGYEETALNADNLNLLQTNTENAINNVQENTETAINSMQSDVSVKGKYIKVCLSESQSIEQDEKTLIKFDTINFNNFDDDYDNYFSLEEDGSIQINNDNITSVLVIGNIQMSGTTTAYLYINKNSSDDSQVALQNYGGGNQVSIALNVVKGDKISLSTYYSESGVVNSWTIGSWLEVIAL